MICFNTTTIIVFLVVFGLIGLYFLIMFLMQAYSIKKTEQNETLGNVDKENE